MLTHLFELLFEAYNLKFNISSARFIYAMMSKDNWVTRSSLLFLSLYEGKSISKLQIDIEFKQIRVLIWKYFYFST
jgi:hypothetical protein